MAKLHFTEDEVVAAIESSRSTKEFLIHLGMKVNNGNYRKAEDICRQYGLTVPKHDSKNNIGSLTSFNKMPDEEFFKDGVLRNGGNIRKRLIQDLGVPNECSVCGLLPIWNGKPLTLQVDHIDGNRFNNKLANLRIICGHCHSQTPTFSNNRGVATYNYCDCGIRIHNKSTHCKKCNTEKILVKNNISRTKAIYPPVDELIAEVNASSFVAVAERLGVSDNAVRKYIERKAGKDAVPRGYAKGPKPLPLTRGQQFLLSADVSNVISEIEKPDKSLKSYAAEINVAANTLRDWLEEKLGYRYVPVRNKQTLNPKQGRVEYPDVDVILASIANNGAEYTAKSLGVTSKAVERHLRKHLPSEAFPLLRSGFLASYKHD